MANSEVLVLFKGKDVSLIKTTDGIGGAFGKLERVVKIGAAAGVTALAGLATGAIGLGAKLIGLGSDAEEMQGKFNVVFAQTGDMVTSALSNFADEVGRSKFELMEMASTFGDTLKPMGFTEEAAADMSVTMSQLATDLGSFNNMSMTESLERLQGTLIGNHENALAFGVIINENTLKAELAANGWDKLTGATLEQAKVQARINLLMAGTTDAQGDAARTAGSWANQMRRLKSRLTDAATEAGSKLLPALTPLLSLLGNLAEKALPLLLGAFDKITPIISDVSGFIRGFVSAIQEGQSPLDALIDSILNWTSFGEQNWDMIIGIADTIEGQWIPAIINIKDQIVAFMTPIIQWIQQNIQLKDVLIALGIVLGGVVLGAIVSVATAILPIIAAGAALVGIVALVRTAWEENWGGIQEKTQIFVNFWNNTLWPGLQQVWEWMQSTLWPFLRDVLAPVIGEILTVAIQKLTNFWTTTLLPAIQSVWTFLTVDMMPVWQALGELIQAYIPFAIEVLKQAWIGGTQVMRDVWSFVKDKLGPILQWLRNNIVDPLTKAIFGTNNAIQGLVDWINRAKNALDGFSLPDILTPGSPTPFELGLIGIRNQFQGLTNTDLPQFNNALAQTGQVTNNNQRTINQNFTVNTSSVDIGNESRAGLAFATGGI